MIQDYYYKSIRASAILTGSYVAATTLGGTQDTENVHLLNELILYVSFTIGNLTDLRLKIEFSSDNTTFYQETSSGAQSSGVVTDTIFERKYTATGNYRIAIPVKDRYIKVSVKGTGADATNSLCAITALVGIA